MILRIIRIMIIIELKSSPYLKLSSLHHSGSFCEQLNSANMGQLQLTHGRWQRGDDSK